MSDRQHPILALPTGDALVQRIQALQQRESVVISTSCYIEAQHDGEAIACWLRGFSSQATQTAYRKEAERFRLWCVLTVQKTFAALVPADLQQYAAFLLDPQPRALWCGPKGPRRGDPKWRPFVGPLSPPAQGTAINIIQSLLKFLIDAQYMPGNIKVLFRGLLQHAATFEERQLALYSRILEPELWQALLETLWSWPDQSEAARDEKERLHFIVAMLYFLGLRISDLATSDWRSFRKIEKHWWFFVVGKGGKLRKIPVNNHLLEAVIRYRTYFGMSVYPLENENGLLVRSLRYEGKTIGIRQIANLVKMLVNQAAECFPASTEHHKKLRRFSPHWLRHQSGTLQSRFKIPKEYIKENMGHSKIETTDIYIHNFDDERHAAMNNMDWFI